MRAAHGETMRQRQIGEARSCPPTSRESRNGSFSETFTWDHLSGLFRPLLYYICITLQSFSPEHFLLCKRGGGAKIGGERTLKVFRNYSKYNEELASLNSTFAGYPPKVRRLSPRHSTPRAPGASAGHRGSLRPSTVLLPAHRPSAPPWSVWKRSSSSGAPCKR